MYRQAIDDLQQNKQRKLFSYAGCAGLEHNSLDLNQLKVKLCSNFKVLERPLCAKSGTRRSSDSASLHDAAPHRFSLQFQPLPASKANAGDW